jgi:hypothetical protein
VAAGDPMAVAAGVSGGLRQWQTADLWHGTTGRVAAMWGHPWHDMAGRAVAVRGHRRPDTTGVFAIDFD